MAGHGFVRTQIEHIHELIDSLPDVPEYSHKEIQALLPPLPPPFWIKSAPNPPSATILAMVFANWLNPPGQSMFILGAWVFTGHEPASPGGRGDMRAFHYVIYTTFCMGGLAFCFFSAHP